MQSQSFGNKRCISRKAGHKNMAAHAESCELRTLLCASVTSAGVMQHLDLPMYGIDFEIMPVIEPGNDEAGKFAVDDSISPGTNEGPGDLPVDGPGETPVVWQPDGPGEWPVDEPVDGPGEWPVDGPVDGPGEWPVGWQPDGPGHWPVDGPVDGPVDWPLDEPVDGPGEWPVDGPVDGLGEWPVGWQPDGPDEWSIDSPMAGPDSEKLLITEDVCLIEAPPLEGRDPSWDYHTLMQSLVMKDDVTSEGEPAVVDIAGRVPLSAPEWSDPNPFVISSSAAASGDGVEVQRSQESRSVPTDAVATSALVIPVRQSTSISLFNVTRDRSSVSMPADVQSNSALADSAIPAKRNAGQKRSSTLVRTATQAGAVSEGLINLKPLLGDDAESSDNDAHESTVDPQAVESGSIEETVSAHGDPLKGASGFATNKTVPPRTGRAAMIDQFMAQYAENSFNS